MSFGKVPGSWSHKHKSSVYGNHDDPVSGSHQARSHQKNSGTSLPDTYPREGGRVGSEVAKHNWNGHSARENELTSTAEV